MRPWEKRVALLVIALSGGAYILWGEVFPMMGGLGYDGAFLARIVADFVGRLRAGAIDLYFLGKSLPAVLLWTLFKISGWTPTAPHIVRAFQLLNVACVLGTVGLWFRITRRLNLSATNERLGVVLLVVNFCVAKFFLYNPVLSDASGFFVATLLLYAHLSSWRKGLVAVGILGAFTFPLLLPVSLILYVWPHAHSPSVKPAPRTAWRVAIAAGNVLLSLYFLLVAGGEISGSGAQPWRHPLALAGAYSIVFGYLFFALRTLSDVPLRTFAGGDTQKDWIMRAVLAAVILAGVSSMQQTIAGPSNLLRISTRDSLVNLLLESIAKPGVFLVAHVFALGPVTILLFLRWRQVRAFAATHVAYAVLGGLLVVLALFSESRSLIIFLPFGVLLACAALEPLSTAKVAGVAAVAFGLSHVFYPINRTGLLDTDLSEFPAQGYFMNFGPWLSTTSYLIEVGAFVVAFLLLGILVGRSPRATS